MLVVIRAYIGTDGADHLWKVLDEVTDRELTFKQSALELIGLTNTQAEMIESWHFEQASQEEMPF